MAAEIKKVRFNFWLPEWMLNDVTLEAGKEGRDVADIIRQKLSEWLAYKRSINVLNKGDAHGGAAN